MVARCLASDTAMQVTTDAVQIFGGFMKDFPVERYMRDAKITQVYKGLTRSSAWSSRGSCSADRSERRLDLKMGSRKSRSSKPFQRIQLMTSLLHSLVLQAHMLARCRRAHSACHARSRGHQSRSSALSVASQYAQPLKPS